jgi:hypothetical protein
MKTTRMARHVYFGLYFLIFFGSYDEYISLLATTFEWILNPSINVLETIYIIFDETWRLKINLRIRCP